MMMPVKLSAVGIKSDTASEPLLANDTSRKIIHIDMDAFFAAVEERDHPELRGRPLVIARHPKETGGRGVVTTANYKAREYGIHSAMSARQAYELCPYAVFKPGDYRKYKEISYGIRQVFLQYTDKMEAVSIDEAYLDVTENKHVSVPVTALRIQQDIWRSAGLTCSAGISYNKFLAKLASDFRKPRGLTVVTPGRAENFLKALPIEKFYGVGKKTELKMKALGIFTGEDLYQRKEDDLVHYFGKHGRDLYRKVRGIHLAPVENARERKSVSCEHTFDVFIVTQNGISLQLRRLAGHLESHLTKIGVQPKTVVLKVRYADYTTLTRQVTLPQRVSSQEEIYSQAKKLWDKNFTVGKGVRLLGIGVAGLGSRTDVPQQLALW